MEDKIKIGIEIERKYIIKMPSFDILEKQEGYSCSEIVQTYLKSLDGVTRRVRKRSSNNRTRYIETLKVRIDNMSSTETEEELTEQEYLLRLSDSAPDATPIIKNRHVFLYKGQFFEIDVYPQWTKTAVMETELESREKSVEIPDFIEIISEVTGDKSYSNASMSRNFPDEII